jgi:hypothetical protein
MLVRVDVYPFDYKPPSDDAPPPQTLYACLASASSNNDGGRILTVGRRTGDIVFGSDKSVSREHVILRIASLNKTHQQQQPKQQAAQSKRKNASDQNDDLAATKKQVPLPLLATTPEQIQACKADGEHHMCVILENAGKLGTFVVQHEEKPQEGGGATTKDDDETDDEDDHIASQYITPAAAGIPLSATTLRILQRDSKNGAQQQLTLKPVALVGQQMVLPQLAKRNGVVVVQCGKLGSTLVIQRVGIQVVKSGAVPAVAAWQAVAHQLGLTVTESSQADTNLMITTMRNSSPKQLSAWLGHIPAANQNYLQHLLHRSSPADPLFPLTVPEEYAPRSDGNDFWNLRPNPRLWSSCTLIRVAEGVSKASTTKAQDDLEWMVRSAGAAVLSVSADELDDETQVASLKQRMDIAQHCFAIPSRAKAFKLLQRAFPTLPTASPTSLAKCITEQRLPVDDESGNVIGVLVNETPPSVKTPVTSAASTATVTTQNATDAPPKKEVESTPASRQEVEYFSSMQSDELPSARKAAASPSTRSSRRSTVADTSSDEPSRTTDRAVEETHTREVSVAKVSGPRRACSTEEETQIQDAAAAGEPRRQDRESAEATLKLSGNEEESRIARPTEVDAAATTSRKRPHSSSETHGKRRKLLETTKSGWFNAAPKGVSRLDYLNSPEYISQATGVEKLNEVAVTDVVGLVVAASAVIPATQRSSRVYSRNGPDFRRFCKNAITVTPPQRLIVLQSVLPTSRREETHELDEETQALREQQRRADELFRDPGRAAPVGRAPRR